MINRRLGFRPDIQGMRALAVLLVLVFHIFPAALSGGYVGVDVFFVISGFLICGLILKQAEKDRKFSVMGFYARRIKRLLPAASVVLLFSVVGAYYFLPYTRWGDTAQQIIASALYFENIHLYRQAIDYLTADTPASPVQHFWSLSIEEQFYIFWPILMVMMVWFSNKFTVSLRACVIAVLTICFAASLYFSIHLTNTNPQGAYFLSHTRIWELALGGICVALLPYISLSRKLAEGLMWVGVVMIIIAGARYTTATAFPGYAALLPTLGVALLLVAGGGYDTLSAQRVLQLPPFRFIGDISYSLYLWHWPIIIFYQAQHGEHIGWPAGVLIIVASILVAWVSKVLLEDPIRKWDMRNNKTWSFLLGAALILSSIAAALCLLLLPPKEGSQQGNNPHSLQADYPGALALRAPQNVHSPTGTPFIPTLEHARGDVASVYKDKCHAAFPDDKLTPCLYIPVKRGDGEYVMEFAAFSALEQNTKIMMLLGDSHAAQWLPALKPIAAKRGWAIITHTKSSCAFIDAPLLLDGKPYSACFRWGQRVIEDVIQRGPEMVFTSMIAGYRVQNAKPQAENQQKLVQGLVSAWSRLGESEIPVYAIKGTPRFEQLVPDCVAKNLKSWTGCNISRTQAMKFFDAIPVAARQVSTAYLLDMTDSLCSNTACEVIVGNVLVYRDQHHITATYMKSMSGALQLKIQNIKQGLVPVGADENTQDGAGKL